MATHTVADGDIGTTAFALTAATVDTVTFTGNDLINVEIVSDGAAAVWYTLDSSTPTVGGANCYYIPATPAVDRREPRTSGATVVKLISSGTPTVRVQWGS